MLLRRIFLSIPLVLFGFGILFISVFRTASVKYDFEGSEYFESGKGNAVNNEGEVNYFLPNPGKVLPDSPLWILKAARDKLWDITTSNPERKAELYLLFADKRLVSSIRLFEKGELGIAYSTLTKAEKNLEKASLQEEKNRKNGRNTTQLLRRLSLASLKHEEVIKKLAENSSDDMRPLLSDLLRYPRKSFEDARNALLGQGIEPPNNPNK